jgi:hypothetical protein
VLNDDLNPAGFGGPQCPALMDLITVSREPLEYDLGVGSA